VESEHGSSAPISVLGKEYFVVKGQGNDTAEQTTVIATEANTAVTVEQFATNGSLINTTTKNLSAAGDFFTFNLKSGSAY
jgi:hypothetical protein